MQLIVSWLSFVISGVSSEVKQILPSCPISVLQLKCWLVLLCYYFFTVDTGDGKGWELCTSYLRFLKGDRHSRTV